MSLTLKAEGGKILSVESFPKGVRVAIIIPVRAETDALEVTLNVAQMRTLSGLLSFEAKEIENEHEA